MIEILLTRHGETECNRKNILCGGGIDSPLSEKGLAQAEALAYSPHFIGTTHIWSSTLQRALQTATLIAQMTKTKLVQEQLLVEQHGGIWEGKSFEELYQYKLEVWSKSHKPGEEIILEGGESRKQVAERAQKFIDTCLAAVPDKSKVVVVSHGAWIEGFLHSVSGIDYNFLRRLHIDNCSISCLEYHKEQYIIRSLNDISHLKSDAKLLPVQLLRV